MFSIVQHTPVTYGDYVYPGWAVGVGWLFAICSMVPLPVLALVRILKAKGSLHKVCKPDNYEYCIGICSS